MIKMQSLSALCMSDVVFDCMDLFSVVLYLQILHFALFKVWKF